MFRGLMYGVWNMWRLASYCLDWAEEICGCWTLINCSWIRITCVRNRMDVFLLVMKLCPLFNNPTSSKYYNLRLPFSDIKYLIPSVKSMMYDTAGCGLRWTFRQLTVFTKRSSYASKCFPTNRFAIFSLNRIPLTISMPRPSMGERQYS